MNELGHKDWIWRASAIRFRDRAFIDGRFVPARSGRVFASLNPATGQILAEVASCGEEDMGMAVAAARRAFDAGAWSRRPPGERKDVLLRLATLMRENGEELALLESLDMGRLVRDAAAFDVPGSAAIFQWHAETIDKIHGEVAPTGSGDLALLRREPLGVVGAVVSWNSPLELAALRCAPALAAGNSVVLKPAERAPLAALRLAELAMEAGVPAGVFNVVPGLGETAGQALGRHMDVDCLAFAGTAAVGRLFLQYSGQSNMKQVWLAAGGKSPNLIFEDCADLDAAADMAAFGIFNQGRTGSAVSRLLVQRGIGDALVERLAERASATRPGDPLDPASKLGAMADARHAADVLRIVKAGRETARLVTGGEQVTVDGSGSFVTPAVFDDVSPDDPLAREEIYGPVLAVIPFDDEEEAVRIANDGCHGLAASVWTGSLARARRVAERLRAGTVSVNTVGASNVMAPFGGFGQSGSGRDLPLHALDKYTALKTTWIRC